MTVIGADKVIKQLTDLPRKMQARIQDALVLNAADHMAYAARNIQKNSGGGRSYRRGKKTHIASAPGQFPNTDHGELVRSLFFEKRGSLEAVWGASAKHARPLEFGTSRMAARPFMRPTNLALQSRASARVMAEVNAAIKSVRG